MCKRWTESMAERKTIIYIIGAGRSGTTVVDVMLGNAGGVFSAGELNRYPKAKGKQTGLDERPDRTRFWRNFSRAFAGRYDLDRQLDIHREIEYHTGYAKRIIGLMNRARYAEYQAFLRDFFDHLFSSIEESIVVDSSKYPGRAVALSDTLPYRICYLYIKRDPVQVVKSMVKTDVVIAPRSWVAANVYYLLVNHLAKLALRKLRRTHAVFEVRYEDLIGEPETYLQRIGGAFDIDFSEVAKKVSGDEYLKVGDLFAGNTMREQERIKLRRKESEYPASLRNWLTRMINLSVYR